LNHLDKFRITIYCRYRYITMVTF